MNRPDLRIESRAQCRDLASMGRRLALAAIVGGSVGLGGTVPLASAQDVGPPVLLTNVQQVVVLGADASPSNRYDARVRGVMKVNIAVQISRCWR